MDISCSKHISTAQTLPVLPIELVDDIVGEASLTLYAEPDMSSLSSIALTSHACRIQANKARFTYIKITLRSLRNETYGISRMKDLAAVIKSGQPMTTMPGVCAFATSFALWMSGHPTVITNTLKDGYLTYILETLFQVESTPVYRGNSGPLFRSGKRSLTLMINLHPIFRISWRTEIPELLKAFQNLITSSQLEQLVLGGPQELGQDLLLRSGIKHLKLRDTSIIRIPVEGDEETVLSSSEGPSTLQSLDIDNSVSSDDLGITAFPNSHARTTSLHMFPVLTRLSTQSWAKIHGLVWMVNTTNDILRNAPHLLSLSVKICPCSHCKTILNCRKFAHIVY